MMDAVGGGGARDRYAGADSISVSPMHAVRLRHCHEIRYIV